jgi:predicted nucleic acid-binding protein
VSLYLDTSCLLKLFFSEPESPRVAEVIAAESRVVLSSLAKLESVVQIKARVRGGHLTKRSGRTLLARLEATVALSPFELASPPRDLALVAQAQVAAGDVHCRTLDRLHLAAMEVLSLRRLFTNDKIQAAAATALGFDVTMPH